MTCVRQPGDVPGGKGRSLAAYGLGWPGVAGIMGLACALRLYGLPGEAAWLDEVMSIQSLGADSLVGFLAKARASEPAIVPLYFTLEYYWAWATGGSVVALRLLSVLSGVACIPVAYAFGKRWFGREAGIVAALQIACSTTHVYYSQEARTYALLSLLALVSVYALFAALEGERKVWWIVHVAANVLMVYAHLLCGVFLAIQGIFLLVYWGRRFRRSVLWGMGHVLALIPLLFWFVTSNFLHLRAATGCGPPPTGLDLVRIGILYAGGRVRARRDPLLFVEGWPTADRILGVVFWSLLLWFGWYTLRALWRGKGRGKAAGASRTAVACFAALWLVAPTLVLFSLSYLWRPCLLDRYVFYSVGAAGILFGVAVAALPGRTWRVAAASFVAGLCVYQSLVMPKPWRGDWRAGARIILASEGGAASRGVLDPWAPRPWRYLLATAPTEDPGAGRRRPDPPRNRLTRPAQSVLYTKEEIGNGAIVVRDAMEHPLLFNGPGIAGERVIRAASFGELNKSVRRACEQGKTIWVAFHNVGTTARVFEDKLVQMRATYDRFDLGGQYRLYLYRVVAPAEPVNP